MIYIKFLEIILKNIIRYKFQSNNENKWSEYVYKKKKSIKHPVNPKEDKQGEKEKG